MAQLAVLALTAVFLVFSGPAEAQWGRQDRGDRQAVARAQGIPPGHLPPASQCRVWYDNRPPGRQPAPTSCTRAETLAGRDRNARVVYGEDAYWDVRARGNGRDGGRYGTSSPNRYPDNDRAVPRGSVRDPRASGGAADRYGRESGNVGFRNGYRDGLTKGRADAEDGDRYDPSRHSWYRSATRGYENRHGTRYEYIDRYRNGFEAGYAEGYRVYRRW